MRCRAAHCAALLVLILGCAAQSTVETKVEYVSSPLGLQSTRPRFSWHPRVGLPRASVQASYRLVVATSASLSATSTVWDSGIVQSRASQLVRFAGTDPLLRGAVYHWRVELTFNTSTNTSTSPIRRFSVGAAIDASARFIGAASTDGADCPWLRKSFQLPASTLHSAGSTVLATVGSIGYHELWINGKKASSDVLAPAVSDLSKRILLRTYDITPLLRAGEPNVLGLWLARGWSDYTSVNPSVPNLFNSSAGSPITLAQLSFTSEAAPQPALMLVSDGTWQAKRSDTRHLGKWRNSDFGGDEVNHSLSEPLWASPQLKDSDGWQQAVPVHTPAGRSLSHDCSEPNQLRERIAAKAVRQLLPFAQKYLVEFERPFAGWVSLSGMKSSGGATVAIKASSVPVCGTLEARQASKQGRPFCSNAPEYNMEHRVVTSAASGGNWTFLPRFSYHEVHYLVIEGLLEAPALQQLMGYRVGNIAAAGQQSGRATISTFESSDQLLNQVYRTSIWTLANLVTGGMSVDCPHRERLGYLGDAHTSLETALQNLESGQFYTKWLQDIQDVQSYPAHTAGLNSTGYVPHTAPTIDGGGGPAWSGFLITMPWQVYLTYGDVQMLQSSFSAMESLLSFWGRSLSATDGLVHDWGVQNGKVIDPWTFLGDWVSPHGSEQPPQGGLSSPEAELFNNCYILYCTRIVSNVSNVLGFESKASAHHRAAEALAAAIHSKWFNQSTATYLDSRQTHLAMPLISGAVPFEYQERVWAALSDEISGRQAGHIDTGLQGLYFMTKLLYDTSLPNGGGHDTLVHQLATVETAPGYSDLLSKGYSTWPEEWGRCGDGDSNPQQPYKCNKWTSGSLSVMHGTLNGIGQWFVSGIGGIRRPAGHAGFALFALRPPFGVGGVSSASASFDAGFGPIRSSWSVHGRACQYNVSVPPNTEAHAYLPTNSSVVRESGIPVKESLGVHLVGSCEPGTATTTYHLGSGDYFFSWRL